MDILSRLESEVRGLADRNRELEAELSRLGRECATAQEENRGLRLSLASEAELRKKALAQITALRGRIQARLGAEKVL